MLFQARKTFIHLRNTNYGVDEIREISDPAKIVGLGDMSKIS